MKRLIPFFILTMIVFLNSCGPDLKEENRKLREEVVGVHDEVMPMMGKIKSLEKKALDQVKELESETNIDTLKVQALKAVAYDLDQAYEAMFDWMHQYESEDGDRAAEVVKADLEEQMVKVTKVNEQMKAALEKAEKELNN